MIQSCSDTSPPRPYFPSIERGKWDEVMGNLAVEFVPMSGRGRDEVKLSVNFGTNWDEVKLKSRVRVGRGRDEVAIHA